MHSAHVPTIPPHGKTIALYKNIATDDAIRVMSVTGFATEYELWQIDNDVATPGTLLYVMVTKPTSGPMHWMQRWGTSPHDWQSWTVGVNDVASQIGIQHWFYRTVTQQIWEDMQ